MTTALEIVQAVVDELGLPQVTFINNNVNTTVRQIMALLNRAGDELYQAHEWTVSQAQFIVEIGNPIITTGDITSGSGIITNIPSTAGIVAEQFAVTGNQLQTSTRVKRVVDANTVEVDMYATGSSTGAEIVFSRDTFAVPAEFKWFIDRTMWDRTNHWELIGPVSPQDDQWQRSGIVTTGPRRRWRQIGEEPYCWRLWPPPTSSGDYPATLVFEYNSKQWARTAAGVGTEKLANDDDYPVIDAQALILSTKWRLWQAKRFEYADLQAEYLDYVSRLQGRDGGSGDLSLARPTQAPFLITPASVPDGNWPGN